MHSRRNFLQYCSAMGLASFSPRIIGAEKRRRKDRILIGAQTNTWGVPIKPFDRLLEIVSELGKLAYTGFEMNYARLDQRASHPLNAVAKSRYGTSNLFPRTLVASFTTKRTQRRKSRSFAALQAVRRSWGRHT